MPNTIDGTPFSTSAVNRRSQGTRRSRDSARYTPASMPTGNPHRAGERDHDQAADDRVGHAAAGLAHRLRQMGEEVEVDRRGAPGTTRKPKIRTSGKITTSADSEGQPAHRRVRQTPAAAAHSVPSDGRSAHAPHEQAGQPVDHDRDDEQQQADLDQGRDVEVRRRLGELVGDDAGHGVAGREQRDAPPRGGCRSPSSPPSSRRARARGRGGWRRPAPSARSAAPRCASSPSRWRRGRAPPRAACWARPASTSRLTEVMYGTTMMARIIAGREHADAVRRALEERQEAEPVAEERLHGGAQPGHEDEDAPEPVDDAGNGGEQLDQERDRADGSRTARARRGRWRRRGRAAPRSGAPGATRPACRR